MTILIQHFKVKEFAIWKAAFDGNQEFRTRMTFHNPRVFQHPDDPTHVMVFAEIDDPQPWLDFVASDEYAVRRESSGHVGQNDFFFLEEVPLYV